MRAQALPAFHVQQAPVDPHTLARAILSESRFRVHLTPLPHKTWWDIFMTWLGGRWNQLVQAFAQHVHIGSKTSIAAGDIILALAACFVIITAVRLIARAVRDGAAAVSVHAIPPHVSARALYAQSLEHAAHGSYAAAITLLFRSSVAALDLRGIVHDEPSLTVNEYRREVRSHASQFAEPFDTLARIFTSAVYAEAPVTPALWDCAHQAYMRLVPTQADAA